MSDLHRLEAVAMALRALFPDEVTTAVETITQGRDDLWPEERSVMLGAVPARLAEYGAGRRAARRALAALGLPPQALPTGPDRAPVWPLGSFGSIAHAGGLAVAVASQSRIVGVDIELEEAIAPDLWSTICSPTELRRLPLSERGRHLRRVFAAKEAVFKAQDPTMRAMFGYEVVDLTLADLTFDAQFLTDAGAFGAGQRVQGSLAVVAGLILAGVVR